MPTGKLAISRGHQLALPLRPLTPEPPASASPEYQLVHDRLSALERLTRLFEQGALSAEEFAAEKAIILKLPADELVLQAPAPVPFSPAPALPSPPGPSLLGRLLHWKFLPVGLAAGLALSAAAQPNETIRFFDEALRLFGA